MPNIRYHAPVNFRKVAAKLANCVDCFTTVFEDLKNYFVKEIGIPEKSVTVIPNGVDTSRIAPGPRSEALLNLLPDKFDGKVLISCWKVGRGKGSNYTPFDNRIIEETRPKYLFNFGW